MQQQTHQLDTRGMNCPLPIVKTKKRLKGMQTGEVLQVMASDPGSIKDMTSFCAQTGHHLMAAEEDGANFVFQIRKV
ncbi:sulfurtransferase TusA family protein [Magnetococcus sp. PR-3]|uniref:sulfurtransferase TusA family protein n=1 Tax=Magnetococcus sp. PR-3 TaxID=3120355 RepID=UPI002FCE2979